MYITQVGDVWNELEPLVDVIIPNSSPASSPPGSPPMK